MQELHSHSIDIEYASTCHIMRMGDGAGYMRLLNNVGQHTWYKSFATGWDWLSNNTQLMEDLERLYQEKVVGARSV